MYHMQEAILLSYDEKTIIEELMVHSCQMELP